MKIKFCLFFLIFLSIFIYSQDNTGDRNNNSNNQLKQKNGWDYYAEGKYRESLIALENEKKYFPERINIYIIMAWCYKELKDFANMEKISLEGIKLQPADARVLKNLAESYYFQNKYAEAVEYYQKYLKYKYNLKNDPYISTVYYYLGICFYNLNSLKKADICLSTSLSLYSNNVQGLLILADIKERDLNYTKALELYNKVLQLKPDNQRALDGINRIKDKV